MKFQNIIQLAMLPLLALATSCSNSVQELPSDGNATFLVAQLNADSELVADSTIPALKEASFLHFKACLRDVAVQSSIVGEEFEVQGLNKKQRLRTDGEGCLAWSQAVVFPWLSSETWIKQKITVTAVGHHLGQVNIPVYFNPWREGTQGLVDGRYHQPTGPISNISELEQRRVQALTANNDEKSPLNLTNMSWSVLRRRTRAQITILEWKLQATPVFERQDLTGQILREQLTSGRAELQLQLDGHNMYGARQNLSERVIKTVEWQGGILKVSGELSVPTEQLPRIGDIAELYVQLKLPNSLPKVAGVLPLTGIEQAAVSELQSIDTEARAQDIDDQTRSSDLVGAIDVSNIKVLLDNDDMDGYLLDENLQLSLTKNFRIEFNPTVVLPGSEVMGQAPTPLTQGKLDVKLHLFAPKSISSGYQNPDLDQFIHLSSTSSQVDVRADGLVSHIFKLPLAIAKTPLLRLKNLIIIEVTASDHTSALAGEAFAIELFPLAATNQVTAFKQTNNHKIQDELAALNKYDGRELVAREKKSTELLRNSLEARASKKGHSFVSKNMSELGTTNPDIQIARLSGANINAINLTDMRDMMSSRELPKATLSKLCREFFQFPKVERSYSWGRFSYNLIGGKEWLDCVKNPKEFIKTSPSDHLEEFLRPQKHNGVTVTQPKFLSQARGDIFRGTGFFAAFGDRSSDGSGERIGSSVDSHVGFELTIPFVTSVGIGADRSHSVYRTVDKASMRSSFERQYTQQKDIELEYNRITLEFLARMRRCLSVEAEAAKKTMLICEDGDRLAKVEESWYFIGDTRLNRLGVITNATMPDDTEMAQVLRGESSFRKVWDEFREEDRALILEKLDGETQGIFHTPLSEQLRQHENIIGVGFPGAVIPY